MGGVLVDQAVEGREGAFHPVADEIVPQIVAGDDVGKAARSDHQVEGLAAVRRRFRGDVFQLDAGQPRHLLGDRPILLPGVLVPEMHVDRQLERFVDDPVLGRILRAGGARKREHGRGRRENVLQELVSCLPRSRRAARRSLPLIP